MKTPDHDRQDDIDAVKARVDIVALIRQTVKLHRSGRDMVGRCPFHNESTPSFKVRADRGFFKCFGCGVSGDVIKFVQLRDGCDFLAALDSLLLRAGIADDVARARAARQQRAADEQAAREDAEDRRLRQADAQAWWNQTVPAAGTPAEAYMRARGLNPDLIGGIPRDLRFWARAPHTEEKTRVERRLPAVVSAIRDRRGDIVAIHAVYLLPDGSGKAPFYPRKVIRGPFTGGAIHLTPPRPLEAPAGLTIFKPRDRLDLGEGWETCWAYWQLSAPEPFPPFAIWAACTLGNICGAGEGWGARRPRHDPRFHAMKRQTWRLPAHRPDMARPGVILPASAKAVVLLRENDSSDPRGYEALLRRAVTRFERQGRTVLIADPGVAGDHNDRLQLQLQGEAA